MLANRCASHRPWGVSRIDGAYAGEFAEARLGMAAQDGSTGLRRVGGDDQGVCATRGTGSADMGEQAPVVSRGRLRVVKDIDGGCYRHKRPRTFGCPVRRIRHFYPTRYSATDTEAMASSSSSNDERSRVPRS